MMKCGRCGGYIHRGQRFVVDIDGHAEHVSCDAILAFVDENFTPTERVPELHLELRTPPEAS